MLTTNVQGVQIAFERRGQGLPMVLVHGYPLDHTIWNPVIPWLESYYDLILPDLRGFGQSSVCLDPYSLSDMAADLNDLLDSLEIQKAAITGHSMGGYVALAFAHTHPGRLLGLGLVASQALPDNPEKKVARYLEAEAILADGIGGVAEKMSAKLTDDPVLQKKLKELIQVQRPEALAGALRAMAGRLDSNPLLPGLNMPVVLVHGQADQLIPVERARDVQRLLKKGHLVEIKEAGHMPMMEAPRVTAKALKVLLQK